MIEEKKKVCVNTLSLFSYNLQIEAEFSRLTSVNLKTSFFNGLDYYQPGLLDLYKAKAGKVAALRKLMACLNDVSLLNVFVFF